jgi:RNA polymerase sigma-70 factor (ECF subfamily)
MTHDPSLQGQHTEGQGLALYDQLLAVVPTPVVALNRAIAVGEVHGPAAALALMEELALDDYDPFHATHADLLRRVGRHREAAAAYKRAAAMAPTDAERDFLTHGGRASH